MKLFAAPALVLGLFMGFAPSAVAQTSDPKIDFLGMCIKQGSSTNYCACMADQLGTILQPKELAVYNDYLGLITKTQDQAQLITQLTERNGITKQELGRILKAATDGVATADKACTGL